MSNIQIINTNVVENYILIDPLPGSMINPVVDNAIELAAAKNRVVAFDFNGVRVKVTASSKAAEVVTQWREDLERNRQAYLESDEYKAQAEKRKVELEATQKQIDALVAQLPSICTQPQWVEWVAKFAAINDNMHLRYPKIEIAGYMKAAGYERNDCVGDPEVYTDYDVAVRWLMGQAMDHLLRDMPIHPGLSTPASQLATRQIGAKTKGLLHA